MSSLVPVVLHFIIRVLERREHRFVGLEEISAKPIRVVPAIFKEDTDRAYLLTRNWRLGKSVSIPLEIVPRYEVLAPLVLEQHKAGHSLQTIASANNISWEFAKSVLNFAETGQRPHHRNPANRRTRKRRSEERSTKPISLCHQLADRVRQMRDEENLTYPAMCRILLEEGVSISVGTLRRAYDFARPDVVAQAVKSGTRPQRGSYRHLPAKTIHQVHNLLKKGVPVKEIVKESGVSRSSVVREKIKLFGPNQSE